MKKRVLAIVIVGLGLIASYYLLSHANPTSGESERSSIGNFSRHEQLLDRYRAALSEANGVIEDMNLDIETAQQIEHLEELEGFVDVIPLRDVIAHPQP